MGTTWSENETPEGQEMRGKGKGKGKKKKIIPRRKKSKPTPPAGVTHASITAMENAEESERDTRVTGTEYVLVFYNESFEDHDFNDEDKKSLNEARRKIVDRLRKAGLLVKQRISADHDEVFVKVSAPYHRLHEHAEEMGLRVLHKTVPATKHDPGYIPYMAKYWEQYEELSSLQRQRIIYHIMISSKNDGGANVRPEKQIAEGRMLTFFPMHDERPDGEREKLVQRWGKSCFSFQPLEEINAYYGPKVALYFAFLGFYTIWLGIPAIFGAFVFAWGIVKNEFDNMFVPIYCIVLAFWVTFFLEFWKRQNAALTFQWDMDEYEVKETLRSQFRPREDANGEAIRKAGVYTPHGFVDISEHDKKRFSTLRPDSKLKTTKYFPQWVTSVRQSAAFSFISLTAGVVIVATLGLLVLRLIWAERDTGSGFKKWATAASALNGVVIALMNVVYSKLAKLLNDWENWRTETMYEDNLATKIFLFQFVNSYFSLFYIAFLKSNGTLWGKQDKCTPDCMTELTYQLGVILVTKQISGQFLELGVPYITTRLNQWRERKKVSSRDRELSVEEVQAKLRPHGGTMMEFSELVIQFGFVTMFASAFPLGAAVAMIANYVEIRLDSMKMLRTERRPDFHGAQDIGPFFGMLKVISIIAVITNLAITGFVSNQLTEYISGLSNFDKLLVVVIAEHAIFFIKFIVALAVPDQPAYVARGLAYQKWRAEHLFNLMDSGDKWKATHENVRDVFDSDEEDDDALETGHVHGDGKPTAVGTASVESYYSEVEVYDSDGDGDDEGASRSRDTVDSDGSDAHRSDRSPDGSYEDHSSSWW